MIRKIVITSILSYALFASGTAFAYDVTFASPSTGGSVQHGFGATTQDVAQQFQTVGAITSGTLDAYMELYKSSGSTGTTEVQLWSDSGANTPSTLLYTSATVENSSIGASACGALTQFTISGVTLGASQKYWLLLHNSVSYGTTGIVACGQYTGGTFKEGVYASGVYYDDGAGNALYQKVTMTDGSGGGGTTTATSTEVTSAEAIIFSSLPLIFIATFFMFFYFFIIV